MTARNHWKPWTTVEERRLAQLADLDVPPLTIARELDRSENAIRNKAKKLGIVLPLYKQRHRLVTSTVVPVTSTRQSHRSARVRRPSW
jgi:UDP:flavonoid glycosyltransferase YjiC (YdhE family)